MSDSLRLAIQLGVNIIIAGFVVVMAFLQLAEYVSDRHMRHLFSVAAWLVLMPVFVLRTLGTLKPPLLDPQFVMDWATVGWSVSTLLAVCWGLLRIRDKNREAAALKRLRSDTYEMEKNHGQ